MSWRAKKNLFMTERWILSSSSPQYNVLKLFKRFTSKKFQFLSLKSEVILCWYCSDIILTWIMFQTCSSSLRIQILYGRSRLFTAVFCGSAETWHQSDKQPEVMSLQAPPVVTWPQQDVDLFIIKAVHHDPMQAAPHSPVMGGSKKGRAHSEKVFGAVHSYCYASTCLLSVISPSLRSSRFDTETSEQKPVCPHDWPTAYDVSVTSMHSWGSGVSLRFWGHSLMLHLQMV